MFNRKKKSSSAKGLDVTGEKKEKDDDDHSVKDDPEFDESKLPSFLMDNKSPKSLSLKEKMMKKQMEKFAAKMQQQQMQQPQMQMQLPHENNGTRIESQIQISLEKLQAENEALSSRCRKLEAQNIIAAAQMVDFLAIMIGLLVTVICYVTYARIVWWLLDYEHYSKWIVKSMFLLLPYMYNKMNFGVIYRRFQVLGVFVVFITRVKLVRWRVKKYAKSDDSGGTTSTSILRGEGAVSSHFGDDITEDDIWEANYEINARFLYSSILRLRGLWTKTAQYLSSRADFVPISYVRELSKLQDEAPETEWDDVQKMLSKAGILEHFSHVEKTPIASASIGQVHAATLKKNDENVVIKVQHPSALTLLSDDFVSLNIMAWMVGILEPEFKFFGILMREWANEAHKELDFLSEVDNLESAKESIDLMNSTTPMMTNDSDDHVPFSVEIPRPFKALSSKRVMVMNFCEGKRIDDLDQIDQCNVPKEAVMNALTQTFAHMMYVTDIFNGDPHPGNIFIRPGLMSREKQSSDGAHGFTIVLLDWGLAKRLPESKRAGFCEMTYAAATFDFGLMMDAFKTLGLKLKRENVAEDMEGVRFMLRDMAPRETARRRVKAKMKTDMKRSKEKKKGERVPVESNAYPGEFFFFVRTNELLHGLGSKLGVDMKYLDALKAYAEKGLKSFDKYKAVSKHPDPIANDIIADKSLKKQIDTVLNELQMDGKIAGAQVCVIKDDETLAHNVIGNLGSLKSHLVCRSDSVLLGFSVTKATAATLVNKMVEDGYLQMDEPICERIWTEFCPSATPPSQLIDVLDDDKEIVAQKWRWKRCITLKHILTHTTGLWSATPANLTIKNLASCEACCQGFEYNSEKAADTILPLSEPGSNSTYQYLSFGWLVAGCVIGAYSVRHGERKTYEEIYNEILGPLHSEGMKKAGFFPCGMDKANEVHDMAHIDSEIDITEAMQKKREAEAMGDLMENMEAEDMSEEFTNRKELLKGIKGREFILDPRIWNSEDAISANVPAAGGRFSAKALSMFYHELGNGKILSPANLTRVTAVCMKEKGMQSLQGQTSIVDSGTNDEQMEVEYGLGYQIIRISDAKDGYAFGHAGVGGSIGFHHVSSNTSVGIMFNKVGGKQDSAKDIINIISRHLEW